MDSNLLIAIVFGYLLGSIPFTQLVARTVKGIDLRKVGSQNVGGRNLTRQLGLAWGLTGGMLDVGKGFASIWLAEAIGVSYPLRMLAGIAAVAGHNWPVWLKFRGGKGLATFVGAALYEVAPEALIASFVAIGVLVITKNILLTSLTGFITILALAFAYQRSAEVMGFLAGLILVVLIASAPDIVHKFRSSGGLREYMKNPNKVYEEEARQRSE
ncbi:MAG: glycerol-3-phosphate acyltransferase [Anaerolineales bacterium]